MDGGFELAVGLEVGVGTVMKQAVGKRAAQALVEAACTPRQSSEVRTSDEGTYSSVASLPLG